MVGGIVEAEGEKWLHAPFSAGFGAVCWRRPLATWAWAGVLMALEEWARGEGLTGISLVLTPWFYHPSRDETLQFCLLKAGYTLAGAELTAFLSASRGIAAKGRQNARRAQRHGAQLMELELGEAYRFIKRCKDEAGLPVSVTEDEMLNLAAAVGDKLGAWGVFFHGELGGAMIVQRLNPRCSLGFMWAHDDRFSKARAADFLVVRAAEAEFSLGAKVFDLGTVSIGGEVVEGVERFKRKLGAAHALRARYIRRLDG